MSLDSALPSDWDAVMRQSLWNAKPKPPIFAEPELRGPDVVNKPPHYNNGGVECIDYIQQQLGPERFLGYLEGNTIKYLHRWKYKNGIEDLRKARWYLERLIKEATKAP